MATLILQDGTRFEGESFGAAVDSSGEVVFSTGMVGYPESLTDPSFRGQILTFTYPLIGNYGVPSEEKTDWGFSQWNESENIQVQGVVVSQMSETHSHFKSVSSFDAWLKHHKVPGITGIDTRALTKKLREHGVMLGRIVQDDSQSTKDKGQSIEDPNLRNLVAEVSCKKMETYEPEATSEKIPTVICYDCGMKRNALRSFLKKGVKVVRVPWNFDIDSYKEPYHGVFISNGPGDPKMCKETITAIKKVISNNILTFGVCLGNQLVALAAGGNTYKLKYGHRGSNQPCLEVASTNCDGPMGVCEPGTKRCIITSQNHGFAVDETLPTGWEVWYRNANDGTVEGIRHTSGRFCAVQFHPEAGPGPEDADILFDHFVEAMRGEMR